MTNRAVAAAAAAAPALKTKRRRRLVVAKITFIEFSRQLLLMAMVSRLRMACFYSFYTIKWIEIITKFNSFRLQACFYGR